MLYIASNYSILKLIENKKSVKQTPVYDIHIERREMVSQMKFHVQFVYNLQEMMNHFLPPEMTKNKNHCNNRMDLITLQINNLFINRMI